MKYNNVISFDGRQQESFRSSSPGVVLPSETATPMITPQERPASSAEVLFEQLAYLIQFADQEPDRLQRVKAILLETFN